jgi:hypothetical protein
MIVGQVFREGFQSKIFVFMGLFLMEGCNKLVQVPNPISSVTSNQVFSSDATATAAMLGIYSNMIRNPTFSSYKMTYYAGESADELRDATQGNEGVDLFLSNTLTAIGSSNALLADIWQPAYFDIYSANAIIAGVQSSTGIHPQTRAQLLGEAKFIRAFCYFYLTNLFSKVPLDLTTDFNKTVLLSGTPLKVIYQQIISDLHDAASSMIEDFSLTNGQPIRANKWAAVALLARVYLYRGDWEGADSASNAVINSGRFSLVPLPVSPADALPDSDVFVANSKESILQLQPVNNFPNATLEGNFFIPFSSNSSSVCWLTPQLLGAFEYGDLRWTNWVDSTDYQGSMFYYPFKYKDRAQSGYPSVENYTLLRYAEQFLVRAEAEANLGQLPAAIGDVNVIRKRAGLPLLSDSLPASKVSSAIQQENRIEFFAEWGHRWLDLKRWNLAIGMADTISYKTNLKKDSFQVFYPIPIDETSSDPNLAQNPGY